MNALSKVRVYELAKELGISSKDLISLLKDEFSIEVKNHMSVVEEEDALLIKEFYGESEKKSTEEDIEEKYGELQE
ncbi:translation initiation factor IF-2, partial [Coprococcus sp. MSK.21.13]|nr:translation initiation factor IF-2 [Coprococcus sp. MSK.21.13]